MSTGEVRVRCDVPMPISVRSPQSEDRFLRDDDDDDEEEEEEQEVRSTEIMVHQPGRLISTILLRWYFSFFIFTSPYNIGGAHHRAAWVCTSAVSRR